MTWKEAIRKVLLEEGKPLHYTDITNKIFEKGYRGKNECGATPEQTVCAQLATNKNIFKGLGGGVYELTGSSSKDKSKVVEGISKIIDVETELQR